MSAILRPLVVSRPTVITSWALYVDATREFPRATLVVRGMDGGRRCDLWTHRWRSRLGSHQIHNEQGVLVVLADAYWAIKGREHTQVSPGQLELDLDGLSVPAAAQA